MRTKSLVLWAFAGIMLCGCASVVPSKLEGPAPALLRAPAALADLKAGDDLVKAHASTRRSYATETSKLKRLQRYVRTVLQK